MKIKQIAHHRNGVTGEPFDVVLFSHPEIKNAIAVVFDTPSHVAVFDLDKIMQGDINFGSNSWRGDYFEADLRNAIQLEEDGTSGQDREAYTDDQDRENYTCEEE